jgi:hypothetical protein
MDHVSEPVKKPMPLCRISRPDNWNDANNPARQT